MVSEQSTSIIDHFSQIPDPRIDCGKLHNLVEIMVIAICGVICGADDWASIEEFGKAKLELWVFEGYLLPNFPCNLVTNNAIL